MVKNEDERPQEDFLAVHYISGGSGRALLEDLLRVIRSTVLEFLSVMSYPTFSLSVYCTVLLLIVVVLLCYIL